MSKGIKAFHEFVSRTNVIFIVASQSHSDTNGGTL